MTLIDWLIVVLPMAYVLWMAFHSRRYIHGVADFLSAGRVCGRYVISVSDIANGLAIYTVVAGCEGCYASGVGVGFWGSLTTPLWLLFGLTGYCVYRFRETRAMSIGQFLEMRYSRSLRIFASGLRTVADIVCNMILPAISARFFIYLLGLPHHFRLFGINFSTFGVTIGTAIALALYVIWCGGTVSLIITDTIQTLLAYPIFAVLVVFILCTFSWHGEVVPVMADRVAEQSFLNPYDAEALRDFNIFAIIVNLLNYTLNAASWTGAGATTAGRTPHEQKMAGLLGYWKNGFSLTFFTLAGIIVLTFMNHRHFAPQAQAVRTQLSARIADELIDEGDSRKTRVVDATAALPLQEHVVGQDPPLAIGADLDTPYLEAAHQALGNDGGGNHLFQKFRTLYYQLLLPSVFRVTLPRGLFGLFVLLMLMLMVSTDDSRIFSAALTVVQDIVMPLYPKRLSTATHVRLLRIASVIVGGLYFCGSFYMAQMDYIALFIAITASIWIGGAGPVMVGGLYTRFGTTAGAYASLLSGLLISVGGIVGQQTWAAHLYPWLTRHGWAEPLGRLLETVSRPFWPYVEWHMDPVKFPINSNEMLFIAMVTGCLLYVAVSYLTMKKPFDLNKMLHRGAYADKDSLVPEPILAKGLKGVCIRLMGIDSNYTRGDKIIAWSSLAYSVGYGFIVMFVAVILWNRFSKWPLAWWDVFFYIKTLLVPCLIAAVSTVWFSWGGLTDLKRMFRDLKARKEDPDDNGRVEKRETEN